MKSLPCGFGDGTLSRALVGLGVRTKPAAKPFISDVTTPKAKRPAGSLPPSKPPPARHHSGDRSAHGAMAFSLYRRPALERRSIMLFSSWLRNWKRSAPAAPGAHKRPLANGPTSARGWKRSKIAA